MPDPMNMSKSEFDNLTDSQRKAYFHKTTLENSGEPWEVYGYDSPEDYAAEYDDYLEINDEEESEKLQWAHDIYPVAQNLFSRLSDSAQNTPAGHFIQGQNYYVGIDSSTKNLLIGSRMDDDYTNVLVEYDSKNPQNVIINRLEDSDMQAWSKIEQALSQLELKAERTKPDLEL